jgi:hypothetical protein
MSKFVFAKDIVRSDFQNDIKADYRILEIPSEMKFPIMTGAKYFDSLAELKKSEDFQHFKLSKSQEADKIIAQKNIFKIKDFILFPTNDEFGIISFSIIHHLIFGKIQNKTISGIHYLDSILNPDIEITGQPKQINDNGVIKVDIYHKSKKIIKNDTTLFPKWSISQLMFELYFAFNDRIKCDSRPNIQHSLTFSGVKVKWVFENGKFKTVYPII